MLVLRQFSCSTVTVEMQQNFASPCHALASAAELSSLRGLLPLLLAVSNVVSLLSAVPARRTTHQTAA
jgi:hypothetical protein